MTWKDLEAVLINDATLSASAKRQISDLMGEAYAPQNRESSLSKLTELAGEDRIKRVVLALRTEGYRQAVQETQAVNKLYLQAIRNGEVVTFKDLVVGLINDATLSVPVKRQVSDLGKAYTLQDKKSSFGKLKDLVGKERIRRVMLALTAAGATVPAKRAAPEETQAETQPEKRYLQTIDEVAEEYMCPITFELPIDPVIAEDDRCYERCAIEEWFER